MMMRTPFRAGGLFVLLVCVLAQSPVAVTTTSEILSDDCQDDDEHLSSSQFNPTISSSSASPVVTPAPIVGSTRAPSPLVDDGDATTPRVTVTTSPIAPIRFVDDVNDGHSVAVASGIVAVGAVGVTTVWLFKMGRM